MASFVIVFQFLAGAYIFCDTVYICTSVLSAFKATYRRSPIKLHFLEKSFCILSLLFKMGTRNSYSTKFLLDV